MSQLRVECSHLSNHPQMTQMDADRLLLALPQGPLQLLKAPLGDGGSISGALCLFIFPSASICAHLRIYKICQISHRSQGAVGWQK